MPTYDLSVTKVFFKNLEALNARNPDGSRKYKYIINQGSSRSSKTFSLIDLFDYHARTNPNERLTIWRDTKTDCKKTVLHDMLKHHKMTKRYQVGYSFNKTESILSYSHPDNGTTTVEIHGTDDEETVHGLTQNIAWLNEPYKISEDTFDQIDMRSDVLFIDYNPKKDSYINDIAKQPNAIVILSTYKDNPFCPEQHKIKIESHQPVNWSFLVQQGFEDEDYIKRFEDRSILEEYLSTKDYEKKHKNELMRCYDNFKYVRESAYDWQVYGLGLKAENPNKIYHNWIKITDFEFDEIKRKKGLRSYYGLDFGYANPSACVEVIYDGDRAFYLRQKFYKPLKECTQPLGNLLIEAGVPTGNVTYIYCDLSDNVVGVGDNIVRDLRSYHGLNVFKSKKPKYQDRFNFINSCTIFYTESSPNIEEEYEAYEYEFINDQPTEKPKKVNDHILNAIEYCLWSLKFKYDIKL